MLVAAAFYILVLGLAVITLEIDHTVMIYRDLFSLGKLPVDIYKEPVRSILTFIIPVGIMVTLPAKVLMGIISMPTIITGLVFGVSALFLSIKFWNYSLKYYTSASS